MNGAITARANWAELEQQIINCTRCPRLRRHCLKTAREKKKAYQDETYWGLPIPGFGDHSARLLIVGLAPAAHGANRTGRIFTGDRSGDWLYRALFKAGFCNQPQSQRRDDGLILSHTYISCINRCAPPDNKPNPTEVANCLPYLKREFELLRPSVRVIVVLGQIALNGLWKLLEEKGTRPRFRHGARIRLQSGVLLLMSYHPSQQNTFTGRLTEPMFDSVFRQARSELGE